MRLNKEFKARRIIAIKMNNALLEKTRAWFCAAVF